MLDAHAGFFNGGRCLKKKDPLVGWDDCAVWSKLENVVLEGNGTLDANGDFWWNGTAPSSESGRLRPMMLDLMYVDVPIALNVAAQFRTCTPASF